MNLEKSKLKLVVAEGIGRDIEKDLESAQIKVYKYQGAHDAMLQACRIVSELSAKAKDDLFNDKVKLDPDDPMVVAKFVVGKMQEVVAKLHEMSDIAKVSAIKADGERAGLEFAVKRVKGIFDGEVAKVEALKAQIEAGEVGEVIVEEGVITHVGNGPRPPGVHPGPTLKMIRQQEVLTTEEPQEVSLDGHPGLLLKAVRRDTETAVTTCQGCKHLATCTSQYQLTETSPRCEEYAVSESQEKTKAKGKRQKRGEPLLKKRNNP